MPAACRLVVAIARQANVYSMQNLQLLTTIETDDNRTVRSQLRACRAKHALEGAG